MTPQVAAAFPSTRHDFLRICRAADFQNHGSIEAHLHEFANECSPLDPPLTRRQMLVTVALVVVNMEHSEVGTEFVDQIVEIPREKGVAGVQTRPDLICIERAENPNDVAGTPEKQMREFVF